MPLSRLLIAAALLAVASCSSPELPGADCRINDGACVRPFARGTVSLDITPRPVKAMRELSVVVRLDRQVSGRLRLDMTMPGMNMGINIFDLSRISEGIYTGSLVIPRCPGGQKLWRAAVVEVGGGELAAFHMEIE